MDKQDAQHIKELLESSEINNRRLAVLMMSEMESFEALIEVFGQEDKVLLVKSPKVLKKHLNSEAFKKDKNWTVWEDGAYNYTFKKEHPFFIIHTTKKRLRIEGVTQWQSNWDELSELVTLALINTGFEQFPSAIKNFRKLEQLEFSGNQLSLFPAELLQLPRLKVLRYKSNQTTTLAPEMIHTECMQLDLSDNNLAAFPATSSVKFLRLTDLLLQNNQIEDLGAVVGDFDSLRNLNLSKNPLRYLPKELYQLYNLGSLNLAETGIQTLSSKIGELKKLYTLNLKGTTIQELPDSIKKLKLKRLDISYTPMAKDQDYLQYLKKILTKTIIKDKI